MEKHAVNSGNMFVCWWKDLTFYQHIMRITFEFSPEDGKESDVDKDTNLQGMALQES